MAIPIDQMPIGEGRHPDGNPGTTFFVDRTQLSDLEETGPESKLDDARFILEAVGEPDAIFERLRRDDGSSEWCYSVRPTHDPQEPEATTLPRYGFAFLVFVRPGVGGYVVSDWEWREENAVPGLPLNWQNDFTRRLWQKT